MDPLRVTKEQIAVTETSSGLYVPPFQLTKGQPRPIAANGGLSYMALDRDGDAGTGAATEAALHLIAEGTGQAITDMLETTPPGPIETKWGIGFRRYEECLEYIRAKKLEGPVVSYYRCVTPYTSSPPIPLFHPTRSGGILRALPRQKRCARKNRTLDGDASIFRKCCAMPDE